MEGEEAANAMKKEDKKRKTSTLSFSVSEKSSNGGSGTLQIK
jgi:hypothetical protein